MNDINQRISKIEVLLQKINFLVSNVKENQNETTAEAEIRLIQSYIAELHDISKDREPSNLVKTTPPVVPSIEKTETSSTPKVEEKQPVVDEAATKAMEEVVTSENGSEDQPTLNETLKQEEKDLAETVVATKIKDLKTAIDINQKFAFINELFNGDVDEFSQALDKLNSCSDLTSANHFLNVDLKEKHKWDQEPALNSLKDFVTRRYL